MNRRLLWSAFYGFIAFVLMGSSCNEPRWTTYRAGPFNPGWLAAGATFQGTTAWKFVTGGPIFATPVFGQDGTVYFGSCDGKVYALDGLGTKKWEFPTGGCVGGVLVSKDTVYATSGDQNLYALDLSLNLKWQFRANGPIHTAPLLYGETVYVAADDKLLYAVDINAHKARWTKSTGDLVTWSPVAWASGNGIVIVGSLDHNVYAFDDDDGHQVWKFGTGDEVDAAPAIDTTNGRVLIGSADRKMYSLDASTGAEVWEFAVPDPIVRAAVVLGSGNIYFMTDGGEFYGLDKNKNKLWDPPGSTDRVAGSPILNISNGLVFASAYHTLYLLNPSNHTEAALFEAGGFIEDPSFGPNGLVVAGSLDNTLYAIR